MKRVLIIRFSSIGDIVLTTPVIRNVKRHYPQCEIHFLTKPQYRFLLGHNPYISHIHTLENNILLTGRLLRKLQFDAVIDLHNNLRSHIITSLLQIPVYRFDKLNLEKWLLVNFKLDVLPRVHVVERYLGAAQALSITNDNEGLDYFLPESIELPQLPASYSVYVMGAQHYTKRMPNNNIREWCSNQRLPVVLLGGNEDTTNAEAVASGFDHVINLCGKLSFHESALVVKHAKRILTHDTGLMHVAAAFKKPVEVIWGNTLPAFGMYPYYGKYAVKFINHEVNGLPCRPCSKIGFATCPKGHFNCMQRQSIEE